MGLASRNLTLSFLKKINILWVLLANMEMIKEIMMTNLTFGNLSLPYGQDQSDLILLSFFKYEFKVSSFSIL